MPEDLHPELHAAHGAAIVEDLTRGSEAPPWLIEVAAMVLDLPTTPEWVCRMLAAGDSFAGIRADLS